MVHKSTNATLFFGKCGWLFFYLRKAFNWVVLGVFHGDLNFFDLHEILPNKVFCLLKKITIGIFKKRVALTL